ncbi:hypothetical protein N3Z17_04335 [Candidatus Bandiella numerosa]|jgi:hypothetical protein|uniref:hypothetical protein n=1 Tax=Candidatus Bandiella numerosa TaxID=2570586 RepID=UPI00249F1EF5|nr:hypothetical protein [Candidatus Bandiella numerosa]WHA04456.1 hypothetical protein N3Z17_04335 [Candidatus Bandiella numerosa]
MINELVKRLSTGKHEVTIGNREEPYSEIKERLVDMKYIHITFPNTKGGTELGINVDTDSCDLKDADFEKGVGSVHIEGTTNLNYCDVRCVADIDLKTKKGQGALVIVNN